MPINIAIRHDERGALEDVTMVPIIALLAGTSTSTTLLQTTGTACGRLLNSLSHENIEALMGIPNMNWMPKTRKDVLRIPPNVNGVYLPEDREEWTKQKRGHPMYFSRGPRIHVRAVDPNQMYTKVFTTKNHLSDIDLPPMPIKVANIDNVTRSGVLRVADLDIAVSPSILQGGNLVKNGLKNPIDIMSTLTTAWLGYDADRSSCDKLAQQIEMIAQKGQMMNILDQMRPVHLICSHSHPIGEESHSTDCKWDLSGLISTLAAEYKSAIQTLDDWAYSGFQSYVSGDIDIEGGQLIDVNHPTIMKRVGDADVDVDGLLKRMIALEAEVAGCGGTRRYPRDKPAQFNSRWESDMYRVVEVGAHMRTQLLKSFGATFSPDSREVKFDRPMILPPVEIVKEGIFKMAKALIRECELDKFGWEGLAQRYISAAVIPEVKKIAGMWDTMQSKSASSARDRVNQLVSALIATNRTAGLAYLVGEATESRVMIDYGLGHMLRYTSNPSHCGFVWLYLGLTPSVDLRALVPTGRTTMSSAVNGMPHNMDKIRALHINIPTAPVRQTMAGPYPSNVQVANSVAFLEHDRTLNIEHLVLPVPVNRKIKGILKRPSEDGVNSKPKKRIRFVDMRSSPT